MPNLSESFEAAKARAQQDFDEVKRQVQVVADASSQKDSIIDQMAQTETSDRAQINDLQGQNDSLNQQIADAQAAIDAFDLDASFPPAPAPGGDSGTPDPAPAPAPGDGTTPGTVNPPEPPAPGDDVPVGTGAQDVGGAPPVPPDPQPTDGTGTGSEPAPEPTPTEPASPPPGE